MADHTTSVYLKDKSNPKNESSWTYIGKVHTEPFDLNEVKFLKENKGFKVKFPWGISLFSTDAKKWDTKYSR